MELPVAVHAARRRGAGARRQPDRPGSAMLKIGSGVPRGARLAPLPGRCASARGRGARQRPAASRSSGELASGEAREAERHGQRSPTRPACSSSGPRRRHRRASRHQRASQFALEPIGPDPDQPCADGRADVAAGALAAPARWPSRRRDRPLRAAAAIGALIAAVAIRRGRARGPALPGRRPRTGGCRAARTPRARAA